MSAIGVRAQEIDRKKVVELERQRQWQQRHKIARQQPDGIAGPGAGAAVASSNDGQQGSAPVRRPMERQSTRVFSPDEFSSLNLPFSHLQLPDQDHGRS